MWRMTLAACLLLVTGVSSAWAVGVPMMYELKGPRANEVLANLIEESLAKDPSGETVIRGSKCTTPQDFVEAMQRYHPGANLRGVEEFPTYIRSLQRRKAPEGEYRMSRINFGKRSEEEVCTLDTDGWVRAFRDGKDADEYAWYDPNLNKPVLAGDCSNVVGDRVGEPDKVVATKLVPPPSRQCTLPQRGILVFAWDLATLPGDLRERALQMVALEDKRHDSFKGDSFSRTLGDKIDERVSNMAPVTLELHVSLAETEDVVIGDEKPLPVVRIENGHGHLKIPSAELNGYAVRFALPQGTPDGWNVLSPTVFGVTGLRELRILPDEWGAQCSKKVHILAERRT